MANISGLSSYAKRMGRLSARIFGELVRPTSRKSTKVIRIFSEKPVDLRPEIVNYYPDHVNIFRLMRKFRNYGLYRDEFQDFKEEMERLRKLRGKGRPELKIRGNSKQKPQS